MQELLTVNELAKELKVPKTWIYTRTREIGPEAMPRLYVGKYLRFDREAVRQWIIERSAERR